MVQGVLIDDDDGCSINTNPATGQVISHVPCTTTRLWDVVDAARQAQPAWARQTSLPDRIASLRLGLQRLAEISNRLVELVVQEMGKPIGEAREEVAAAVGKNDDDNDYFQLLQDSLASQTFGTSRIVRQAHGLVAVLSPWNFPVDEILLLTLPALAAGNVVVVKPSEVVPETGALVVATLASVLPAGVLQVVQGDGRVGQALVECADMIGMTGSCETGRRILRDGAAPQLKRVVLEMGGKDPMMVFEDADISKAAQDALTYSLANTGQVCCSVERVYVAESIYEDFERRLVDLAPSFVVGNGMDPATKVGPMVSERQRSIVHEQVEDAKAKGAKVLYTSSIPQDTGGSYYPVTILSDVREDMHVLTKETFGPVVTLVKFDGSEEEAIRLANATEFGLASMVYTQDLEKAERIASGIAAGQVGINCYALDHMNVKCPWVGHKHSGYGFHSGVDGFRQFSLPKTIVFGEE